MPVPSRRKEEPQAALVRPAVEPPLDDDLLPYMVGEVAYVDVLSHVQPSRVVFRGSHLIVGVWVDSVNVAHHPNVKE